MKRRILAMWAWLTGWFRGEPEPPADYDVDLDEDDGPDFAPRASTWAPGFPATVESFKPSDDEIEATRRLRERSENAHKQACQVAIDAQVADLKQQLAVERARRSGALRDLEAVQAQLRVLLVGNGHTHSALRRAFPRGNARTEILAERAVAELLELRQAKRAKTARGKSGRH